MMSENETELVILGRYAGFFTRAAAFAIDRGIIFSIGFIILVVVQYFLNLLLIDDWLASLHQGETTRMLIAVLLSSLGINLIVSIIYHIGFWMLSGQTPGKRILGVRVIRADGERLRLRNAVMRQVGYWISAIFFLGFLWILLDNRRQGFHDKIGGTIVTYSWPEGRMRGTFVIERVQRFQDRRSSS
jgi:uncharacterized RDD family membrane protein YckC